MAVALALAASTSLLASPMEASAELVKDKYGSWKQTICPVAYFPCWQDGQFCFRPIYCEGKFSPEGLLNASIIFAGILGPAYSIWRRKAGLDPDPNTPEGRAYFAEKYNLPTGDQGPKRTLGGPKTGGASFFSRNLDDKKGSAEKAEKGPEKEDEA